jgi:hypothetical protein
MAQIKKESPPLTHGVETAIFASNNLVKPQTVRKSHCVLGEYHGVVPTKLANGRLLWPDVIVTKRDGAVAANDNEIGEVA